MTVLPNLRHLRAFQAVARLGSVGQASISIHVSQPAVTQAIAKLESQIGAPLFDRRPTGSYLTEFGNILLRRVDRFFAMVEESLAAVDQNGVDDGERRSSLVNLITSTQIRSLVATADPMSAAQAALTMGVSETTLYRSARELEQVLDCRLFRPSVHGLVSTQLGSELARRVGLAVREIDYALDEIEAAKGRSAMQLSIGVLPMSGSFALAAAIDTLTRRHSRTTIKIVEGTYLTLLKSLRTGEVDINFGLLRRPDWANDVAEERLFDDSFCIVVRRDHPLARAKHLTRERLREYEWVVPAPGTPRRRAIEGYFSGMTPPMRFGVETSSISVIRALLSNSDRISVLSRHEVEFEERVRFFAVLPIKLGEPAAKGITVRANWLPTSLHSEFIDLLRMHSSPADADASVALARGNLVA